MVDRGGSKFGSVQAKGPLPARPIARPQGPRLEVPEARSSRTEVVASLLLLLGGLIAVLGYYRWQTQIRPLGRALYDAAEDAYRANDYKTAIDNLTRAYRLDPFNAAIPDLLGWSHLRLGNPQSARIYFIRALNLNSRLQDARLGLGYTYLELGKAQEALDCFNQLPTSVRFAPEARVAAARAQMGLGNNRAALRALEVVLRDNPDNEEARGELARLAGAATIADFEALRSLEAGPAAGDQLALTTRVADGRFQVLQNDAWNTLYIAGVDIGTGAPGKFATEAPTDPKVYLDWFEQIGALNANSVRIYTLLPPAFYAALLTYNREHAGHPLYLFQEIWLKDAPDDNLLDPGFTAEFTKEVHDLVDAVHGHADLPIQRGYAGGLFTADVSPYVLGWLVGREVEPHVVISTNLRNPSVTNFAGRYLKVENSNATEVWLVRACDDLVTYETGHYHSQHPVAFVNWPPLDPLNHPTETPLAQELDMRRKLGEKLAPLPPGIPDDTDVASLDEEQVTPQPALEAGYFGVYHVYPFWPDFLLLDPVYRNSKDAQGLDSYWGYLEALRAHYRRTPILVAEYGLSTSLGIAHFQPDGWNHGGLDEQQQAQGIVRLSDNIKDAGFMGGLLFEWMDEWWKHNWIAFDFEKPFERKPLWHNAMDPEQFFGIAKWAPPAPLEYKALASSESVTAAPGAPPAVRSVEVAADPQNLYVDIYLSLASGQRPDWSRDRYLVALNTCGQPCGSAALPAAGVQASFGANFAAELNGPDDGKLLIADSYNPYREVPVDGMPSLTDVYIPAKFHPAFTPDAKFEDLIVETNRRRYGRDGTFYPAMRYSRSLLRYGDFERAEPGYNSLNQWYYDAGGQRLRLRLAWGLLMVLDPSEGNVFNGTDAQAETIGRISDKIQLAVVSYIAGNEVPAQVVAKTARGNVISEALSWPWPKWSRVEATLVPKQSYAVVKQEFEKLTGAAKRGK